MTPVPPPRSSPRVPEPDEREPDTGSYPVVRADLRKALKANDFKVVVGIAVVSIGTAFGAYRVILNDARAQTDAGVAVVVTPLGKRVDVLEQGQMQQRADTHELQVDIRELYRVVRDGRRSERLETPAPAPVSKDGGQ